MTKLLLSTKQVSHELTTSGKSIVLKIAKQENAFL